MVKIKPSIGVVQLCCVLVGILWIFPLAARAECSSTTPQECTEDECGSKSVNGTWEGGVCKVTPPPITCTSSTLTQCINQTDCEDATGFWENGQCAAKITPPPITCTSSTLTQCSNQTDCEDATGFWGDNKCNLLPTLKVFGIDSTGQSVSEINAVFTGGISTDGGKSFIDATQTPVKLKKGGGIQIKGSIIPDNSHIGSKSVELIVVGLHTSDINDTSCDLATGKHAYYMMVDAAPTSEIYCEWKDGGKCKDDKNLPRVKSKNSADYYTEWTGWDTTLANLKPFRMISSLDKLEEIPLYVDNNVSYTGFVCVNFGYRLDNKTLIFNAESLMFRVSE